MAFTRNGDLGQPVEQQTAQASGPSHGAFDAGAYVKVARAGQIRARWDKAVQ